MSLSTSSNKVTPPNKKLTISLKSMCAPSKLSFAEEKPQLPANYQEDTWKKLQTATRAVHAKKPVTSALEDLYKVTEKARGLTSLVGRKFS